jgi:hypothetical protein
VKKTLLVVALATMLLFAVAGSAFAVNHSGQDRFGAQAIAPADTSTGTAVPGAGTNTYFDWTPSLAGNAFPIGGNSPHGNYTTTTVKCVVCHAVHYAAPGNATVASGNQTADTLLRVRADEACAFCHATAGQAVNGRPVYNGIGGGNLGPTQTGGNFNTGHYTGTNCNCCHSNVHGAGADSSVAALNGYLLLKLPQSAVGTQAVATADMLGAITAIDFEAQNQGFAAGAALGGTPGQYASINTDTYRQQAVGVFCAECHNGAYATVAAGATTNVRGSSTQSFSGHRIAAAATATWTGQSSGAFNGQGAVAWAAANDCRSCHDAKDSYGNTAFPHAWGGQAGVGYTKMWLLSAADAGSAKTSVGAPASNPWPSTVQLSDGVCLKCHVASGGTEGVGISF